MKKIKKRLVSISLISLMIISLFALQVSATENQSDGEQQLQEEIQQAMQEQENSTDDTSNNNESTTDESVSKNTNLSSSRAGSRANETAMMDYMASVATTDNNTDSDSGDTTYTTASAGTLPNSWKNYVNTIWQYKAMGRYPNPSGVSVPLADDNAFQWSSASTAKKWSGRMAGYSDTGVAVSHPWLDENTSNELNVFGASKINASEITVQTNSEGVKTDVVAKRTIGGTEMEQSDPAKDNALMIPFSTYTTETAINDDLLDSDGNSITPLSKTVNVRTFYVWSPEQLVYALLFQNAGASSIYGANTELVDYQSSNSSTLTVEPHANLPFMSSYASNGASQYNKYHKVKIVLMNDFDMSGYDQNWPLVTFYRGATYSYHLRIEMDGNNKVIHNLGVFLEKGATASRSAGLFYGYAGLDVYNLTFESAMIVSKPAFDGNSVAAVGIFGMSEVNYTTNYKYFGASTLDNVHINGSMFFNGHSNSWTSPFGAFTKDNGHQLPPALINQCSTDGCYVYGGDHVSGFTIANVGGITFETGKIWRNASITNSYAANALIVTYGGHSGGFISCYANAIYIKNCFSDIDMYSASDSGGFAGLFSGSIENCFSTGKLEGYDHCGGFAAAVPNSGINKGATITSCYSTVLTGMRQESKYIGGFYSASPAPTGTNKTSVYNITSCYAAGEVSDVGIDVSQDASNTPENHRYSGGFVSSFTDNYGIDDSVSDSYYDKQTTAMKEWSTGDFNTVSTSSSNRINVTNGITGVLTTDSSVQNSGGLVGIPDPAHISGFNGFVHGEWIYTETNYPQLKIFVEATEFSEKQKETVKQYSKISTTTANLENWDQGYKWDADGVRTETLQPFDGTHPDAMITHVGNEYTYDTVRDLVRNVFISDTNVNFDRLITNPTVDGNVEVIDLTSATKDVSYTYAFEDHSSGTYLIPQASGMGWYGLDSGVTLGNKGKIERPIRLISSVATDAGKDLTVHAGELYDHRQDVRLNTSVEVISNLVIGLDNDKVWSVAIKGGYATTKENPDDGPSAERSKEYYAARTYNMETDGNAGSILESNRIYDAWLYTEIWRVKQIFPDDMEEYARNNFVLNDGDKAVYNPPTCSDSEYLNIDSDSQYWCIEKDDGELAVYLRVKTSSAVIDLENDAYKEDIRVALDGVATNAELDKQKWNGELLLYPDTSTPKKYSISYYWLMEDGRYSLDYKVVSMTPGQYNMYMNTHSYNSGTTKDPLNNMALMLEPTKDELATDAAGNVLAQYEKTYDLSDNYTTSTAIYGPAEAADDLAELDKGTENPFSTTKEESIGYTHDATASWKPLNDNIVIKQIQLTLYSRSGAKVGSATVEVNSNDASGKELTLKNIDFYGVVQETDNGITREITVNEKVNLTYKIEKDANGCYYISFDKMLNVPTVGSVEETTVQGTVGSGITDKNNLPYTDENGQTIDATNKGPYINDTMFNIRLDFWVETIDMSLQKEILGNYVNADAKFNFDFSLQNILIDPSNTINYVDAQNNQATLSLYEADKTTAPVDYNLQDARTTVVLGQGETMKLNNIPVGIDYQIVESSAFNGTGSQADLKYFTTNAAFSNQEDGVYTVIPETTSSPNNVAFDKSNLKVTGITSSNVKYIRYTNSKDYIEPTGIADNFLYYLLGVVVVATTGCVYYKYRRRKKIV